MELLPLAPSGGLCRLRNVCVTCRRKLHNKHFAIPEGNLYSQLLKDL